MHLYYIPHPQKNQLSGCWWPAAILAVGHLQPSCWRRLSRTCQRNVVIFYRYGIKGAVYLRSRDGAVAYVSTGENGKAEWTGGTLVAGQQTITVNSTMGSQTYHLFDHITVSTLADIVACWIYWENIKIYSHVLPFFNTEMAHMPVKLPWIFPGAPLKVNGDPRNIQGNVTGLGTVNRNLSSWKTKTCISYIVGAMANVNDILMTLCKTAGSPVH